MWMRLGSLAALALAACGGDSHSKLAITDDNAPAAASEAVVTGPAANNPQSPGTTSFLTASARSTQPLLRALHGRPAAEACSVSGTLDTQMSDTSITITFDNCNDGDDKVIDGKITYKVSGATTGSTLTFAATIDLTLTEGTLVFDESGSYTMTLVLTVSDTRLEDVELKGSGLELTVTEGGTVKDKLTLSDFTFHSTVDIAIDQSSEQTSDLDYDIDSSRLGGEISVTTMTAMKQHEESEHPYAGLVNVTGASSSRLQITIHGDESYTPPAGEGQVELKVDTGTGSYGSSKWVSWAELDAMATTTPK